MIDEGRGDGETDRADSVTAKMGLDKSNRRASDDVSAKCKHNVPEKGQRTKEEHDQNPAARRCSIQSAGKIDGFLITEKNRRNDLCNVTPQVATLRVIFL